jgi:large subunit ribosomal protein L4
MVDCVVRNWQGEEVGQATLDLRVAKEESAAHIVHRAMVMANDECSSRNCLH